MDRHETRIQRPPETADPDGIYERYCPQCGKTFMCWAPREWCYRRNYRFYCSWTCYREAERGVRPHAGVRVEKVLEDAKKERQHNAHYDPTTAIEQTKKIIARKERGMNNAEIAAELGLTPSVVAQRLTKYGRALGWRPMTKKEAGMNGVRARKKRNLSAAAAASPLSGETGRKRKGGKTG